LNWMDSPAIEVTVLVASKVKARSENLMQAKVRFERWAWMNQFS